MGGDFQRLIFWYYTAKTEGLGMSFLRKMAKFLSHPATRISALWESRVDNLRQSYPPYIVLIASHPNLLLFGSPGLFLDKV